MKKYEPPVIEIIDLYYDNMLLMASSEQPPWVYDGEYATEEDETLAKEHYTNIDVWGLDE